MVNLDSWVTCLQFFLFQYLEWHAFQSFSSKTEMRNLHDLQWHAVFFFWLLNCYPSYCLLKMTITQERGESLQKKEIWFNMGGLVIRMQNRLFIFSYDTFFIMRRHPFYVQTILPFTIWLPFWCYGLPTRTDLQGRRAVEWGRWWEDTSSPDSKDPAEGKYTFNHFYKHTCLKLSHEWGCHFEHSLKRTARSNASSKQARWPLGGRERASRHRRDRPSHQIIGVRAAAERDVLCVRVTVISIERSRRACSIRTTCTVTSMGAVVPELRQETYFAATLRRFVGFAHPAARSVLISACS